MTIPSIPAVPPFGGVVSNVLQNGVGGTTGTDFIVSGYATVILLVLGDGSYGGAVSFLGSPDGTNFTAIRGTKQIDGTIATSVTVSGSTATIWTFQVAGLYSIRASAAADSTNKVAVTGFASNDPNLAPLAATITSTILGAGANVIGSAMIQSVSGTALAADASNTELRVSLYGDTTNPGDTALKAGPGTATGALRVELPTNGTGVVGLNAGSAEIGKAIIEYSTGVAVPTGAGTASGSLRVELPTDGTGKVGLNTGSALIGGVNIVDSVGTNKAGVDASHNVYVTNGGTATVVITASSAGAVKATPGRLCRVLTTSAATAAVNIYDNTNAASGTILATVPASAAIGTVYDCQMPAAVGIYVGGTTGTPGLTVSYS